MTDDGNVGRPDKHGESRDVEDQGKESRAPDEDARQSTVRESNELSLASEMSEITYVDPIRPVEVPPVESDLGSLPTIFGDYEVLHEIARGGMGITYRARQISLNRIVALKMIKSGQLADDQEVRRFQKEAELAASLDHPNIVPVYEVGQIGLRHFFSMAFVDGESLEQRLHAGPLPPQEAARLLLQVAEATEYAHDQGVIHRDLKPANVLLAHGPTGSASGHEQLSKCPEDESIGGSSSGPSVVPKVTDFGLAKQLTVDSTLTVTGQVLGTPGFMPPEQAEGRLADILPQSDVYSLGAILYCSVTGRPPFHAAGILKTLKQVVECDPVSPRQLNPVVDRDLETICLKCLEKDPGRRYARAGDLVDELRRYLDHRPIAARPLSHLAQLTRWCRRRPAVAALSAAFVAALLVGTTVSIYYAIAAGTNARFYRKEKRRADIETTRARASLREEKAMRGRLVDSLDETEQTIQRWVDTASNAQLLQDPRFKPLLIELLAEGLDHYQRFTDEHASDQDLAGRQRLAAAFYRIGKISDTSGSKPQAIAAYQRAIETYGALMDEFPDDEESQWGWARSQCNVAPLYAAVGTPGPAIESFERCIPLFERLVERHENQAPYAADLAIAYDGCALVYAGHGDPVLGLSYRRKALAIREQLTRDHPNDDQFAAALATSAHNVGISMIDAGQLDEALSNFHRARDIMIDLVARSPHDPDRLNKLANIYNTIGSVSWQTNAMSDALEGFQERRSICEQLVQTHPTIDEYRYGLAMSYHNIGALQGEIGGVDEAREAFEEARQLLKKLADDNPTITDYAFDLAGVFINLGNLEEDLERHQQAIRAYERALAIGKELVQGNPQSTRFWSDLAKSYNCLTISQAAAGDSDAAQSAYDESVAIRTRLMREHPEEIWNAIHLAGSYVNRKVLCEGLSEEEILDDLRKAIDLLEGALGRDSRNAVAQRYLRNALWSRAEVLEGIEKYRAAAADWARAAQYTSSWRRTEFSIRQVVDLRKAGEADWRTTGARVALREALEWLFAVVVDHESN